MGERIVSLNRLLHKLLGVIAVLALAGALLTVPGLFTDRWFLSDALLPTLLTVLFLAWMTRGYIHAGVNFACNHFPHDPLARRGIVFAFDCTVLTGGVILFLFGATRILPEAQSWAWQIAGAVLGFDAALFLTGLLRHEDAYSFKRTRGYQQKLWRREHTRRLQAAKREEKQAAKENAGGEADGNSAAPPQKAEIRESLWRGMGPALPSDSVRVFLLKKEELLTKSGTRLSVRAEAVPARAAHSR